MTFPRWVSDACPEAETRAEGERRASEDRLTMKSAD